MPTYSATAYLNRTSRFHPYTEGDTLEPSLVGLHIIEADNPKQAAARVFEIQNRDDRPMGTVERSLSVGDVVVVSRDTKLAWLAPTHRFACDPVGWRKI